MEPECLLLRLQEPILNQMNPPHTSPTYFFKIHFNIIHPSMSNSSNWYLPFRLSDQNFVYIFHLFHAPPISSSLISLP